MKTYKMKINGQNYDAKIIEYTGESAKVTVNGVEFFVELDIDSSTTSNSPKIIRSDKSAPEVSSIIKASGDSSGKIEAPIPGIIVSVSVKSGDKVKSGDLLVILEAMKMESEITAPISGVINNIYVKAGESVQEAQVLIEMTPDISVSQPVAVNKTKKTSKKVQKPIKKVSAPRVSSAGGVVAPIPGIIIDIKVNVGDIIKVDDVVVVLEAMKMESEITSDYSGKVKAINVKKGESVQESQLLIEVGE